jgi:hypothetical protein
MADALVSAQPTPAAAISRSIARARLNVAGSTPAVWQMLEWRPEASLHEGLVRTRHRFADTPDNWPQVIE